MPMPWTASRRYSIRLRDYQEECLQACLHAFHVSGVKRQAVSLPVGSGKTVIFSHLIARLAPPTPAATRTLVLAHREELLEQACRTIERVNPRLRVGIDQGRNHADPRQCDVVVASVPTLGRTACPRLANYDPASFKLVIVDEAHHAAADSYLRVLRHFGVFEADCPLLVWGCSATLSRNDHLGLNGVFQRIVFHVDLLRLMRDEHLSDLKAVKVDTDIDLTALPATDADRVADFDVDQLSLAIDTPRRNQLVAATWKQVAWDEHRRRSTIVFGLNVKHVQNLAHEFSKLAVTRPAVITADTHDAVRRDILEMYSNQQIGVLLNCAVLTEGTDLPRTDCVLLTRPTCNPNLYIQMVGRGLRKHPSKEYCLLLDFVDKHVHGFGRSLVTFPSLFPKRCPPAEGDGDGDGEDGARTMGKKEYTDHLISRIKVQLSYSDLSDSFLNLGGHRIAWVPVEPGTFVATANSNLLTIVLRMDLPTRDMTCSVDLVPHGQPAIRLSESGTPLHAALEHLTMHLVQHHKPSLLAQLSKDSHWRRHPITTKQCQYVSSLAIRLQAHDSVFRDICRWTVGEASDLLAKYVYLRDAGRPPLLWADLLHDTRPRSTCLVRRPRRSTA